MRRPLQMHAPDGEMILQAGSIHPLPHVAAEFEAFGGVGLSGRSFFNRVPYCFGSMQ
jgi:hypothetical protein